MPAAVSKKSKALFLDWDDTLFPTSRCAAACKKLKAFEFLLSIQNSGLKDSLLQLIDAVKSDEEVLCFVVSCANSNHLQKCLKDWLKMSQEQFQ